MIDWNGPLQFEDGTDCTLYATLYETGKCRFADGSGSEHADAWADLVGQGATRLVISMKGDTPMAYGENGVGIAPWDYELKVRAGRRRVMNVPPVSEASMASMAESDMWGMF